MEVEPFVCILHESPSDFIYPTSYRNRVESSRCVDCSQGDWTFSRVLRSAN